MAASPGGVRGGVREFGPTGSTGVFQMHPSLRCNLRCRHCYSMSGPDVDTQLPVELACEVVAQVADLGYEVLGISGGEPLLYPGLLDVLAAAKSRGMTTTVTTNGMLLTPRRIASLAGQVDVLAVSLDGTPTSHVEMRGDPRAFSVMASRLGALRSSGIPFGFVFTLTQANLHEFEWVCTFAADSGASLVQVHPLEPEGAARVNLSDAIPDTVELAFAAVEAMRLREGSGPVIQIDLATRRDLTLAPERFLALDAPPDLLVGQWLTPLVLEADGTLVPLTYGFPRRFALGDVRAASVAELVAGWEAGSLLELARAVHRRLVGPDGPPVSNWYQEMTLAAGDEPEPGAPARVPADQQAMSRANAGSR